MAGTKRAFRGTGGKPFKERRVSAANERWKQCASDYRADIEAALSPHIEDWEDYLIPIVSSKARISKFNSSKLGGKVVREKTNIKTGLVDILGYSYLRQIEQEIRNEKSEG